MNKKQKIIHKKKETFTQITTLNRVLQLLLQYGLHYDSNMVAVQIIVIDQIFCVSLNAGIFLNSLYKSLGISIRDKFIRSELKYSDKALLDVI